MLLAVLFSNAEKHPSRTVGLYCLHCSWQHLHLCCWKDEYDELALAEVIFAITTSVKDACSTKTPTERIFLDKYGKISLCLDEIVWMGMLENTDKDRVRRLTRLKPLAEG